MGTPRKMWTMDEEAALVAGVAKHGAGKWMKILTDEDFGPRFVNRSNVDLKDKWRNLPGNVSRTARPAPQSSPDYDEYKELRPWYDSMVLEALSSGKNPDGIDIDSMHSYIEQKSDYDTLPEIFRGFLKEELATLMMHEKIERNGDLYKIKDDEPVDDDENMNCETSEDLALYAAHRIAVAENSRYKAIQSCKEADEFYKLVEESMVMVQLAEELNAICLRDGFALLRVD